MLTLQNSTRADLCESRDHQVRQHLDVVVIFQAAFDVVQEFEYVNPVEARIQQGVHALERSFPDIQPVVDGVFKRPHFYFTNQLFL